MNIFALLFIIIAFWIIIRKIVQIEVLRHDLKLGGEVHTKY